MPNAVRALRRVTLGQEPGWSRRRQGAGFSYRDARGRAIHHPAHLRRIRSLAIPPAWRDVWICSDARGHVQATGRDARGRLQYRYHLEWQVQRGRMKFKKLGAFCRALPTLRRRVGKDLACDCCCRTKVVAGIVALIERGHLRIGNDEYARANHSYGVTTLERRHVHVDGEVVELHYRGKSGIDRHVRISDARVADMVRDCLRLPGRRVFRYAEAGRIRCITSTEVNAYIRDTTGEELTAKYFRTWAASLACLEKLARLTPGASPTARKRQVNEVITEVAADLGHTRAVCRASYIHPSVVEKFLDESLPTAGSPAKILVGLVES